MHPANRAVPAWLPSALLPALCAALLACTGAAVAQPDARRSGFADMTPALQALQRDDAQNPGWLWLKSGEDRFAADCARCHSLASLRGVAPRYPAWDTRLGKPVTLAGRINQCQRQHVEQAPLAPESDALLGLETVVANVSRGMPIQPPADPRLAPWRARGEQLFNQRMGQLDLSCAQCHTQNAGGRLAGSTIPQAHPTAYPIYRLEWQGQGSLQRRLRNCMTGVRAEPFAFGADEMTALELMLMQRAAGMPLETPGVRP
jgi:sulfur-oxidizing protein SoxA